MYQFEAMRYIITLYYHDIPTFCNDWPSLSISPQSQWIHRRWRPPLSIDPAGWCWGKCGDFLKWGCPKTDGLQGKFHEIPINMDDLGVPPL